jgi:hypothetical protein
MKPVRLFWPQPRFSFIANLKYLRGWKKSAGAQGSDLTETTPDGRAVQELSKGGRPASCSA